MTVVLASVGAAATNTINGSSSERGRMARPAGRSRRGQRVEHAPGISARGGKGGVAVGEGPAALRPLVLGNGPHGLHRARGEGSGGGGVSRSAARRTGAAGRPGNSREREGVAGGIDERGGDRGGHLGGAHAPRPGPGENPAVHPPPGRTGS